MQHYYNHSMAVFTMAIAIYCLHSSSQGSSEQNFIVRPLVISSQLAYCKKTLAMVVLPSLSHFSFLNLLVFGNNIYLFICHLP